MSTITCERGDILLISVPIGEELRMRLRPVLTMRESRAPDSFVSVVPITPDPMVDCNSILVPLGSFESARMGLVTSAYLNTVEEVPVARRYLVDRIGKCPHRLLRQFLGMYRSGEGFGERTPLFRVERAGYSNARSAPDRQSIKSPA